MTPHSTEASFRLSSIRERNIRYGIMALCFIASLVFAVLGTDALDAPRELLVIPALVLYGFAFMLESRKWQTLSLPELNRLNVMLKDLPDVARCIGTEIQAGKTLRWNDFMRVLGLHSEFLQQKAENELLELGEFSEHKRS